MCCFLGWGQWPGFLVRRLRSQARRRAPTLAGRFACRVVMLGLIANYHPPGSLRRFARAKVQGVGRNPPAPRHCIRFAACQGTREEANSTPPVERVCFTVRFFVSTQSRKAAKKMRRCACRTRTDADVVFYHAKNAKNAKRCAFGAALGERY